jgi:hypothetical protein
MRDDRKRRPCDRAEQQGRPLLLGNSPGDLGYLKRWVNLGGHAGQLASVSKLFQKVRQA